MNVPPAIAVLVLPVSFLAAWLYLHKSADVEQRIDVREARQRYESAPIDRDFARLARDIQAEDDAQARMKGAEAEIEAAISAQKKHAESDQRGVFREALDEFLKPRPEEKRSEKQ